MENRAGGSHLRIVHRELFNFLRAERLSSPNSLRSRRILQDYVIRKFALENCSSNMNSAVAHAITSFTLTLTRQWKSCKSVEKYFLRKHSLWLQDEIIIKNIDLPSLSNFSEPCKSAGRPAKAFKQSSQKSKRQKIDSLIKDRSLEEISFATEMKLRSSGKRDAANVLKAITYSPTRATRMKRIFNVSSQKNISSYSPEEALAMIVSAKLTKYQYLMLQQGAKEKGCNLYPSYNKIIEQKQACYPHEDSVIITDRSAEIKLQALVDLTAARLCRVQSEVLTAFNNSGDSILQMIYKWGSDGSGGQSRYKQRASDSSSEIEIDDSNVLATSLVPLKLYGESTENKQVVIWQNPRTASTRFCRPIRFRYIKETNQVTIDEFQYIQNQIDTINPTSVRIGNRHMLVYHKFLKTMVDGKVCNALSLNNYTQQCYICKAKPKDMNNLELLKERQCITETFSLGLSTLHAYIRFFECLLHIAYRLDIKEWQVRGTDKKEAVAARKNMIITRFRKETGLLVDLPKQGTGNTNDGNTARRFFNNPAQSACITGIDEQLIKRYAIILQVLSCGYDVNTEKFELFCEETAQLYVQLYKWFPMPVTVHKILTHGTAIISTFLLPIGQLSEEVQESRHKEFKKFRECYSRKSSRCNTNEDVLHNLLISSDPVISNVRPLPRKNMSPLNKEVLDLLKDPE